MSLANAIFQPPREEVGLYLGVDTTSPITRVKPGFLREAWNLRPGLGGGFMKRGGSTAALSSAWGSRKITGGIEFNVSGTSRVVLFGTDGSGSGGELGYNNAGSVTSIVASLSGTTRPSFVLVDGRLIFFNGVDNPIVYDGSGSGRQLGITPPAAAPTGVQSTNGSLTQTASYQFCYTYYNSTTGAESSPSPIYSVTLTGANDDVTLTTVAGSSATADKIRVYRTFANGQVFYLDREVAVSSTSILCTNADADLGDELEIDNTRLTDYGVKGKYPVVCDNRVFVITENNEGRFSKIGLNRVMPESFQVQALYSTYSELADADKVVGQGVAGSTPIILKERSVGALSRIGLPDFSSVTDNVAYEYKELAKIGAVSHWGCTQILGECIFLGYDNVYGATAEKVRPVADEISATIKACGFSAANRPTISAANNTRYKYVIFSVYKDSSAATPDWQLVGDYQTYPNIRWQMYRSGENTSTHPGWKVGSFFTIKASDGSDDVYYGNFNGDGQYYKTESGNSDAGSYGIWFKAVTRPYSGPVVMAPTLWKPGSVMAQGDGNDYDLTVRGIFDLSGAEEREQLLSLDPGGAVYGTAVYGTDVYGGNQIPPRERDFHKKASYFQFVFEQTEADAPVTVFEWQVAGSTFRV